MYDELTWTVSISAVTGSPSAWSFGCKFQYRQMHAGTAYRFQTPRFYDLADEQVGAHIVEGVGWYGPGQPDNGGGFGVIATQASSLASPIVVTRTLQHFPRGVKLVPQLSFTGGTSPVLKVGIEVTGKSR